MTSESGSHLADILVIPHATYYPPEKSVAENEDVSSRGPVHTLPPPSWTMSHFGSPPRELLKGLVCLVQKDGEVESWEVLLFRKPLVHTHGRLPY